MDQRLIEAGIELGDTVAIKLKLKELGYKPRIILKGPHDEITMECEKGGKGIACTHTWKTTPMQAIRGEAVPIVRLRTTSRMVSRQRSLRPTWPRRSRHSISGTPTTSREPSASMDAAPVITTAWIGTHREPRFRWPRDGQHPSRKRNEPESWPAQRRHL